jgi:ribonuclease HII
MILECGCDEVGIGAGAAEVYVCAVILDPKHPIEGLADSKQLSARKREKLSEIIMLCALCWSIDKASLDEIKRYNVLWATLIAMKRAVEKLEIKPDKVLVDGKHKPRLDIPTEAIIGGDDKIPAISAASILAKVSRDLAMVEYHSLYPEYGFHRHKGYFTKEHMEALRKFGPCPIHRETYAPIRNLGASL